MTGIASVSQLIDEEITAFLAKDPEYVRREQEFYETAHEIAALAGFERYDVFERRLGAYLDRITGLYYFFGLGLRQDILRAIGANGQAATPLPL